MTMTGMGIGKIYLKPKTYVYIPKDVAYDTAFPFNHSEEVMIRIDNGRIIIERCGEL